MKRIVKPARNTVKKLPAMPSTDEIASGIDTEICSLPSCTFPAAPESPSQEESSSDERSSSTTSRQILQEVAHAPDEGDEQEQHQRHDGHCCPQHRDRRGSPRDMRVFSITKRTGYSKTNARKMPMKTMRNVSPIAANAAMSAIAAATTMTVRIGSRSSMRRGSGDSIAETLGTRPVEPAYSNQTTVASTAYVATSANPS